MQDVSGIRGDKGRHDAPHHPRPAGVPSEPMPPPHASKSAFTVQTTITTRRTCNHRHAPPPTAPHVDDNGKTNTTDKRGAADQGDLYVVRAETGERFHLTVHLQGPFHPFTAVTHATLQHTVRTRLMPPRVSGEPPYTLLLDGVPLNHSVVTTLPNNAVIFAHRGAALADVPPLPLHHHSHSRFPSQHRVPSCDASEDAVEVAERVPVPTAQQLVSSSSRLSAAASSEREMSLNPSPHAHRKEFVVGPEAPSRSVEPVRVERRPSLGEVERGEDAPASSASPRRLPPRRVKGVDGGAAAAAGNGGSASAAVVPSAEITETATSPLTGFAIPTKHAAPRRAGTTARNTSSGNSEQPTEVPSQAGVYTEFAGSAHFGGHHTAPNAAAMTTAAAPSVAASAHAPPRGFARSANPTSAPTASASSPSSIEQMPRLSSVNNTQAPITVTPSTESRESSATRHSFTRQTTATPVAAPVIRISIERPTRPHTDAAARATTTATSPISGINKSNSSIHSTPTWDRSKPPPVQVILPYSASTSPSHPSSAVASPSRPSTLFTSPAFSQENSPMPSNADAHAEPAVAKAATSHSSVGQQVKQANNESPAASSASACLAACHLTTPAVKDVAPARPTVTVTNGETNTVATAKPAQTSQQPQTPDRRSWVSALTARDITAELDARDNTPSSLLPHAQQHVSPQLAAYEAQRSAIVSAAAAEQQRLLTRLQLHGRTLEKELTELMKERDAGMKAQETAARLRALRSAQEQAAVQEIDAARSRLGQYREALLTHWRRVLQAHHDQRYRMPPSLLHELGAEGEARTLQCLSSVAGYHTQKARLQGLQQQRATKEATLARLRWEVHTRRCLAEEQRGCLRVVARVRPPLRRPWLPAWVLSSPEAANFDHGYAVHVLAGPDGTQASARTVEVLDPSRELRRRYELLAAYDGATSTQQRLFQDQLQPLLEHMCRTGQRVAVLALGAVGSGKTFTLLGPPAAPPPLPSLKDKEAKPYGKDATAAAAKGQQGQSASAPPVREEDGLASSDYDEDAQADGQPLEELQHQPGITAVGAPQLAGINPCLTAEDAAMEASAVASAKAAEDAARQQRREERRTREESRWRTAAGIEEEDGLLPRAVAWLMAHLRDCAHPARSAPVHKDDATRPIVESVVFSMYEVYNDHIYDLLPALPSADTAATSKDDAASKDYGEVTRNKTPWTQWPRWNPGWLPPAHIRNSNPEQLTELSIELVPMDADSKGADATVSQQQQSQWRVKASAVEVRSATDVLQAIQTGLLRRRSVATLRSAQSSRSHVFLRFRVEVQRPTMPPKASMTAATQPSTAVAVPPTAAVADETRPKGYSFLRTALAPGGGGAGGPAVRGSDGVSSPRLTAPTVATELLFVDFAGSERVELTGLAGDALKEAQYINASLSAVTDVLVALAHTSPRQDTAAEATQKDVEPSRKAGEATSAATSAAALVERWGAVGSRPGVTLARSAPVFLQPRFTKLVDKRYRVPSPHLSESSRGGALTESGLPLRRRVLALMDSYVAGGEAAQWWRNWRSSAAYIPFRTCKTTQLLQSALGSPCKSLVLACVRPCTLAEVVLPPSLQDKRGKNAREFARTLLDSQAPIFLSEVYATLSLAERINTAAQEEDAKKPARKAARG